MIYTLICASENRKYLNTVNTKHVTFVTTLVTSLVH